MEREYCKNCINEHSLRWQHGVNGGAHWDRWVDTRDGVYWEEGKVFCPVVIVERLPEYNLIGADNKQWEIKDGYPPWCPHNGISLCVDIEAILL